MVEKVKTVEINYFCSSYLFWNTNGWCKKAVLDVVYVVVKKKKNVFNKCQFVKNEEETRNNEVCVLCMYVYMSNAEWVEAP